MKILFSVKAFLNYLYNNLIDLIWVKKIRFEDGTEMTSLPVGANIYDIKKLSQAVIDKGWTYLCNSTKQMLPKAKIPTVFNDIENKYINCDKELSEFQKVAVNKSDLKCNYFYNEKLEKYCYLSSARPYKIYSSVTPNLATQTLEYTNDDNKYGNCFAIGKNIIVVAIDSVDIDNIRYYRFDIFDRDFNYLRRIEVNGGSTRKNSQVNIYFRRDTFFYTINGQYGDNDPFQFMVTIKDDVNVNSGTFYKDVFGYGYPTQILQYGEHCPFTNVVDDRFVYMITQRSGSNTSGRKVYKFDLDNNTFTYCGDRHDGETISNLCYHNGKFYEFTRYNNSNNVYESSDCANWTLISSFNTDKIGLIISLGDFCLCFGNNNIYSTTDFITFTVYKSNISTNSNLYKYYRNYIQTDDYFFAICQLATSGTTPYNFFGSTLIPKAYTDTYTINGTTVNIQYYKYEDWKICISDGGANDTNLDTVYNGLGYENYWLLDRNNQQLCLPRNSNLYTQMYVGDDYEDVTVPTGVWSAVALKTDLANVGGVTSGNVVTAYAINNFVNGTKNTVYQTSRPTVINFGASSTTSGYNWFLEVSTDNVNWKTIAGYQVQDGDPDSNAVFSVVIGGNLYWKLNTSLNSYLLRYAEVDSSATDLSMYKLKPQEIVISDTSITLDMILANKNYVFSSNAITDITFTACETSFEETTIEFSTGATAPTLTDNSGIVWVDGSAPTLNANKSYLIVIFNNKGFVKEY